MRLDAAFREVYKPSCVNHFILSFSPSSFLRAQLLLAFPVIFPELISDHLPHRFALFPSGPTQFRPRSLSLRVSVVSGQTPCWIVSHWRKCPMTSTGCLSTLGNF